MNRDAEESGFPRRFYKVAEVNVEDGLSQLCLDGRPARTPGRQLLAVSSPELGRQIAAEWQSQKDEIDPRSMPLTRLVNSALDAVADNIEATKADVVAYSETDLLCYRANSPNGLVERQRVTWDPVLAWAEDSLKARFILAEGVMHVAQPPAAIQAIAGHVDKFDDPIALTGLHMATTLTGSALLALALARAQLTPDEAWSAAHVEEDWNISQWGKDEEATASRAVKRKDFEAAATALATRKAT